MRHPIQPLAKDESGVLRFKLNAIVRYLVDNGVGLNALAMMDFPQQDWEQLAQLIGYSLDGFGELSYVSDAVYGAAQRMADGADERDARIAELEAQLAAAQEGVRTAAVALFRIHPDDLHT